MSYSKQITAHVIADFESWLEKVQKLTPAEYIDFAARSSRALGVYSASFTRRGHGTLVRITSLPNDKLRELTKDFELGPALASSIGNELVQRPRLEGWVESLGRIGWRTLGGADLAASGAASLRRRIASGTKTRAPCAKHSQSSESTTRRMSTVATSNN